MSRARWGWLLLTASATLGCAAESPDGTPGFGGSGEAGSGGSAGIAGGGGAGPGGSAGVAGAGGAGSGGGASGAGADGSAGFDGGVAIGGQGDDGGSSGPGGSGGFGEDGGLGCDTNLIITVRDFTEAHPDFEADLGGPLDGIVQSDLGADEKPVYAHPGATMATTGPEAFEQWYHDVAGVNMRVPVSVQFTETSPGVFVYDNTAFFPIDGMGFGDGPDTTIPVLNIVIPAGHNYLFTTEIHTLFTYKGGEQFTFRGDDDLWVFVNKKLAIDLGGLHSQETESIDMDARAGELGLTVGETYPMDIFHAERHTVESNFRIETTIDFSCVVNVPPLE